MPNVDVYLVMGILVFLILVETFAGYLTQSKRDRGDWIQEFDGFLVLGIFGNTFSIWDQLFGTPTFTRRFPTEYGLAHDPREHWSAPMWYPLVVAAG